MPIPKSLLDFTQVQNRGELQSLVESFPGTGSDFCGFSNVTYRNLPNNHSEGLLGINSNQANLNHRYSGLGDGHPRASIHDSYRPCRSYHGYDGGEIQPQMVNCHPIDEGVFGSRDPTLSTAHQGNDHDGSDQYRLKRKASTSAEDDYEAQTSVDSGSDHCSSKKSQTLNKNGKPRKFRNPRPALKKWNDEDFIMSLLGIIWACGETGLQIPFNQAAQLVGPTCTASALQQAILKLHARLVTEGKQLPKIKMHWPKKGLKESSNSLTDRDAGKLPRRKPTFRQSTQTFMVTLRRAYIEHERVMIPNQKLNEDDLDLPLHEDCEELMEAHPTGNDLAPLSQYTYMSSNGWELPVLNTNASFDNNGSFHGQSTTTLDMSSGSDKIKLEDDGHGSFTSSQNYSLMTTGVFNGVGAHNESATPSDNFTFREGDINKMSSSSQDFIPQMDGILNSVGIYNESRTAPDNFGVENIVHGPFCPNQHQFYPTVEASNSVGMESDATTSHGSSFNPDYWLNASFLNDESMQNVITLADPFFQLTAQSTELIDSSPFDKLLAAWDGQVNNDDIDFLDGL